MKKIPGVINVAFLLGVIALASACVIAPREGYYDRGNARYYHEHSWHQCGEKDEYCR